jgi:hypothetical protein
MLAGAVTSTRTRRGDPAGAAFSRRYRVTYLHSVFRGTSRSSQKASRVNPLASYSAAIRSASARFRCRRCFPAGCFRTTLLLHQNRAGEERCVCPDAYRRLTLRRQAGSLQYDRWRRASEPNPTPYEWARRMTAPWIDTNAHCAHNREFFNPDLPPLQALQRQNATHCRYLSQSVLTNSSTSVNRTRSDFRARGGTVSSGSIMNTFVLDAEKISGRSHARNALNAK